MFIALKLDPQIYKVVLQYVCDLGRRRYYDLLSRQYLQKHIVVSGNNFMYLNTVIR